MLNLYQALLLLYRKRLSSMQSGTPPLYNLKTQQALTAVVIYISVWDFKDNLVK
jgi:hypothetical protein